MAAPGGLPVSLTLTELGVPSGGNRSNRMSLLLDRDWAVLSEADVWGEVTASWLITIVCLVCLWLT